ncbi:hypothetical protein ACF0H5_018178 [Mactra antiquata]
MTTFNKTILVGATLIVTLCFISTHAQNLVPTTAGTPAGREYEMEKDDLILMNVAAKGRVVELLANELARTEIVRALLVEYARECVENITMLEKYCLDCMMDRCGNRMSECHIKGPPLSETINHDPSPIRGLQFLKSPKQVDEHMRNFANKARTDILQGVPETLREQSEAIMHAEVDQSLSDLNENINAERAIQKISLHVQKAADNVNKLPEVGERLGTIIIENEDHAVNLAELLARRLKKARPFLQSMNHNGGRVMEQMPGVIDQVGERVKEFKSKVSGVFNKVLNTFQKVMDDPDTPVVNGNLRFPQMQTQMQRSFGPNAMPNNQNIPGLTQVQQQQLALNMGGQGFPQGQTIQGQMPYQQNMGQGQGQWAVHPNQMQHNHQQVQTMQNPQGQFISSQQLNQMQFQKSGQGQVQGQTVAGRRRRHTDPDCDSLKRDPNTYCRTYESLCHNCTLEKRLRFEVCGEGVEKARDEIKRIDKSVENYLETYEEYVADGPLVLKVELNTSNRLHKTNSFYDAYVTAKVGPSIFRYKTKMILNTDDIRSTGLQVGDEIWEKLWENEVFAEAKSPELVHVQDSSNIMGQVHVQPVKKAHAQAAHNGSASSISKWWTYVTAMAVSVIFVVL